jgi:hypothetical protein
MIPARQLAMALRIAIVMIAVALFPANALAHTGHDHARDAISSGTHAHSPDRDQINKQTSAGKAAPVTHLAATAVNGRRAVASGMCNNGCCASGFSCCAPVMLSDHGLNLCRHARDSEVVRRGPLLRPGIHPDTLPKPPKSFT